MTILFTVGAGQVGPRSQPHQIGLHSIKLIVTPALGELNHNKLTLALEIVNQHQSLCSCLLSSGPLRVVAERFRF
jgi:hypothetical protein